MPPLIETHTVTWDRRTRSGKTASGTPLVGSASGFPVAGVRGSWQPNPRRNIQREGGVQTLADAAFYSGGYTTGVPGDVVTGPDGREYLVEAVAVRTGSSGGELDHAEYLLTRSG